MSSKSVYQYRIFCKTENKFYYIWNTNVPNSCPSNSSHILDTTSTIILDSVTSDEVTVLQKTNSTGINYRAESFIMQIPANSTISKECSWLYNIAILTVNCTVGNENIGDLVNTYVAPNTIIGIITQNVTLGDTNIVVSDSVLQYLNIGYLLTISNGNQSINMGQCIDIKKDSKTIFCEKSANMNINSSNTSFVYMTIQNVKNMYFTQPETINLATKTIGSSFLPKNTKISIEYTNNSNTPKIFKFYLEMFY